MGLGCGIQAALSFGNMIMKVRVKNQFISAVHSQTKLDKSVLEHTTGLITDL